MPARWGFTTLTADLVAEPAGPNEADYRDLRTAAGRLSSSHRRGLRRIRRRMGQEEPGPAPIDGSALPLLRGPQPLRAPPVLHTPCLGMEGQSERSLRELASERFLSALQRAISGLCRCCRDRQPDGVKPFTPCIRSATHEENDMSTATVPHLDMNKLNAFIGQFVADLGAAVHSGMVVIGEKLGL